jgi:hypothetical protein
VVLWVSLEFSHKFKVLLEWFEKARVKFFRLAPVLLPICSPSLTAALVFQPRPHYLIPLFPVFLWAAGSLIKQYSFQFVHAKVKTSIGLAFIIGTLYFLPDSKAYFRIEKDKNSGLSKSNQLNYFQPLTSTGLNDKTIAKSLMDMDWPKGTRIFDASTGYTDYLGQRVERFGKVGFEINYPILSDFGGFIQKKNLNAIFLRKDFFYDRFFSRQKSWQNLKANWASLGWDKIPVGQNGDSLFLKESHFQNVHKTKKTR